MCINEKSMQKVKEKLYEWEIKNEKEKNCLEKNAECHWKKYIFAQMPF